MSGLTDLNKGRGGNKAADLVGDITLLVIELMVSYDIKSHYLITREEDGSCVLVAFNTGASFQEVWEKIGLMVDGEIKEGWDKLNPNKED